MRLHPPPSPRGHRRRLRVHFALRWAGVLALLGWLGSTGLRAFTYVGALSDDVGQPTGVALDTIGSVTYLYVSDHNGGRVFKYNLTTGTRTQIGHPGRAPGQFTWPDAIAIDPTTRDLYIADRQLHRVTRITNEGAFVMKWGDSGQETNRFGHPNAGSGPGQFNGPQGLAIDAAGELYVTEHENHRVQKFRLTRAGSNWNVETRAIIGSPGGAPGEFNTPYGVTLDAAGNVWVADGFNSRLQKFTPGGQRLAQIVVRRADEPHLVTSWVAFDPAGDLYVSVTSDPNTGGVLANQRIEKFNTSGASLGRWGSYGSAPGQFKLPFGIAIHAATNRAYVADWDNRRIQIFDLGGSGPVVDPPAAGRLANLSSRLRVTAGDASRAAIAGFVVTGSSPKQLLVRAVGPGLSSFGVANPLANPRLQIFDQAGRSVAENDDWNNAADVTAATERTGAFRLASGSRDAALVVTVPPGAYTAHINSASGDGVGLLEIYDAQMGAPSPAPKLVNLSTRGFVDTGEGQLAAGFVISGTTAKRVLIRAVGPGLSGFGVPGVVTDPLLTVVASASGSTVAQNDNWETPQPVDASQRAATASEISAACAATGAFAFAPGSRDAAVIATLTPGAYSAVVRGAISPGGSGQPGTGAGLVEVYELPE